MAFSLFGLTSAAPPTVLIRICSTSPVQEPQELAALVCFFTSSTLNRPFSWMALTMVPLHTPLQPHTSMSSGMFAVLCWPWWPTSPMVFSPNIRWSRISLMLARSRTWRKYQPPSAVSPYRQAPTRMSSLTTSFLYTPPIGSERVMVSVPSSPMKSPAENRSMPVTLSLVEVTEPLYMPMPNWARWLAHTLACSNSGATRP
ncbi:hypothetical protein D3C80_1029140 [compost metagenome]